MGIISVSKTFKLSLDYFVFSDNSFYAESVQSYFICEQAYKQFVTKVETYFFYMIEGAPVHGSRLFTLDGQNLLGSAFVEYKFYIAAGVIKLSIIHHLSKED